MFQERTELLSPSMIFICLLVAVWAYWWAVWVEYAHEDLRYLSELHGVFGTYINWWLSCKVWTIGIHKLRVVEKHCTYSPDWKRAVIVIIIIIVVISFGMLWSSFLFLEFPPALQLFCRVF